jgi:hypothetical protein
LRFFQVARSRRRLRQVDVHLREKGRVTIRLRAASKNSPQLAGNQIRVGRGLTSTMFRRGELIRLMGKRLKPIRSGYRKPLKIEREHINLG